MGLDSILISTTIRWSISEIGFEDNINGVQNKNIGKEKITHEDNNLNDRPSQNYYNKNKVKSRSINYTTNNQSYMN